MLIHLINPNNNSRPRKIARVLNSTDGATINSICIMAKEDLIYKEKINAKSYFVRLTEKGKRIASLYRDIDLLAKGIIQ